MPGLLQQRAATIHAASAPEAARPSFKDPTLNQLATALEAKVPPDLRRDYLAIVVAGLKIMYDPQTHQRAVNALLHALPRMSLAKAVAFATVKLISLVAQESRGQMSIPAAFPAAMVLQLYIFEFLETAKGVTVSKPQVAQTTMILTKGLLQLFGITQQQLAQGVDALRQSGTSAQGPGAGPASSSPPSPAQAVPQGGA